jgi:hypothetical protein
MLVFALGIGIASGAELARAQAPATASSTEQSEPSEPTVPSGKVLFSRDAATAPDTSSPEAAPATPSPQSTATAATPDERSALTFSAYDLDVHLTPASAGMAVRAGLTVRNDGAAPLRRLVLDISSSLHWDAVSSAGQPLPFAVQTLDTDADHTGQTQEAVVALPQPLAPGASIVLAALYSGAIQPSAVRLERIGAPADKALATDWDAIAADGTALRGFGNVLWYPVSAAPVFLGDGAKLFQAVGAAKLRESTATVRLRLAIEYIGDPPDAAFFCGQRQPLIAISDNRDLPAAEAPGVATAVFDRRPLGFRTLDLFVAGHPPTQAGTTANPALLSVVTDHEDALPSYAAAATLVEPLLTEWFGATPQTSLSILDHAGQPFEDDALLVLPLRASEPSALAPSLVHSLTHVWIHSNHAWIDEGLAQFAGLLWIERSQSRADALAELQDSARTLALAEPEVPADSPIPMGASSSQSSSSDSSDAPTPSVSPAGQSLAAATGDVFFRTKAAAVWWMLRGIVGDAALQQALQAYRSDARLDADPGGFQRTLEKTSHKDLRWFFQDWVDRDRGLPDLSIVAITPSKLDSRNGLAAGWLVAVDVRNDGYAAAEVPVTVRSGTATQTVRLRIAGQSTASTRIVFAGSPEEVEVNDGSVPETRTSVHTRDLVLPQR